MAAKYKVAIDAGHSKLTAGKRSFDSGFFEYMFNIIVANKIKAHLERHGVEAKVFQVENANATAELNERVRQMNAYNPDIVVSIHANAYGTSWNTANGWEIYYSEGSTKGKKLADSITYHSGNLGLKMRGIKSTSSFIVVRRTIAPAVLVEHFFYTNKEELAKCNTDEYKEKFAVADTKGILLYLGVPWQEPSKKIYKVQVGAFENKVNAQSLQDRLKFLGYSSIIVEEDK